MTAFSRFGRPTGRFFSNRDELRRIDRGLELFQRGYGTEVDWYFLEHLAAAAPGSVVDDVYDEGFVDGGGKRFDGPKRIPVLSAVTIQGEEQGGDAGFATTDRIVLRASYEQVRRAGLDLDLTANREEHLHDRFVWRRRVFDVESIQSSGHFDPSDRDTTILITARQLRTDELYDSPHFQPYITSSDNAPHSGGH